MKNPQTAIHIFNDNSCLFLCYLHWCGLDPDRLSSYMRYYANALDKGYITEEAYVINPSGLIKDLTGRKVFIQKKRINSIKEIKELTPVIFKINQTEDAPGHFVLVENGEINFNPLKKSNCVENGKPYSARVITYA